jgi:alpha-beta hydrolase superfamily lysophospholipase
MDLTIPPQASSHPGTLHFIPPNLCAFEPTKPLVKSLNINTLLWIGGMFDTLLSVSYPPKLAEYLGPTWSVVTASLFSVGMGWGVSTIARDADEMAKIVAYLRERRPGGKIVIMGHSTGCQDCMEYLVGKNADKRPTVDGVILQAPVSDREALGNILPEAHLHEANQLALKWCREKHDRDVLPNRLTKPAFGRIGITARRWVDIASPAPNYDGADDYFSSDHPEERLKGTFGKLPSDVPLLVLYSGNDDGVPKDVDKRRLTQKWMHITEANGGVVDGINGGVIEGASHNLNGQTTEVDDLLRRVASYLERLDKGELSAASGASRI